MAINATNNSMTSITTAARIAVLFAIALMFTTPLCPRLLALDDHNPVGVTGAFEGVITTGCAYNVLSHNATRQIDDIVVPGSIGKYPLKMTRYYNSRLISAWGGLGPGWSHEYLWGSTPMARSNTPTEACGIAVVQSGWAFLVQSDCRIGQ